MSDETRPETWQVEVGGQIYEALLADLPEWINEGSLQPLDKVRKGNLRWIEAAKVPSLVPFFDAKENGGSMPVTVRTYVETDSNRVTATTDYTSGSHGQNGLVAPVPPPTNINGDVCSLHHDTPPFYICGSCRGLYCKGCPTSFGGNVKICPNCDALCKPIAEAMAAKQFSELTFGPDSKPFGADDLFRALANPFKFRASLIFGGLLFMFFNLGQEAGALGGIFMIVAAIFCAMLANALTFGVLANTIENFTAGRVDADFMPNFDEFSLWDDVVHPFFLSIGVYISSFGPLVVVAIIGVYMVSTSLTGQQKAFQDELSKVPGTEFYAPDQTAEQSQQVKEILERVKEQNARRLAKQRQIESGIDASPEEGAGEAEQAIANPKLPANTPVSTYNGSAKSKMAGGILQLAAPLVGVGFVALLWALFYFPAACAVAGYTRSFIETINPLVGIDTIKRLGVAYVKVLVMGLGLIIISGTIAVILYSILAPFNLPQFGNLPVRALISIVEFYFVAVFSCVLGYALLKAGDRLKLPR